MASLRPEKDILSLQSKLEETWNGANVLAALNEKLLKKISLSDLDLDSRKRLLVAVLGMRPKTMGVVRTEVNRLLAEAADDSDTWVKCIGRMLCSFPEQRTITTPDIALPVVEKIVDEMLAFEPREHKDAIYMLPMEATHCCDSACSPAAKAVIQNQKVDCGFKKRGESGIALELSKLRESVRKSLTQGTPSTPETPRTALVRRPSSTGTKGTPKSTPGARRMATNLVRRTSRMQMMGKDESLATANSIVEKERQKEEKREAERLRRKQEMEQKREQKRQLLEQTQQRKLQMQQDKEDARLASAGGSTAAGAPGAVTYGTVPEEAPLPMETFEPVNSEPVLMPQNSQHHRIFEHANVLTSEHRRRVVDFLDGKTVDAVAGQTIEKILMNEQQIAAPEGSSERVLVRIHFEIDFQTRRWKRSRSRVKVKIQ